MLECLVGNFADFKLGASTMRYCYPTICRCILVLGFVTISGASFAQIDLLRERWLEVETENFQLFSQLSSRQTMRIAGDLEAWRRTAAFTIAGLAEFPKAHVPNYVYLFDDTQSLALFAEIDAAAFFSPSPRANYMALVASDESSLTLAFHHYVHFLIRNFSDLRLPRWYEEGLAGYIARMKVSGDDVEFDRYSQQSREQLAVLSEELSMDRLLYRDDALASPRLIQIANLKSEELLHYLLHAYEEDGFIDRREQLQRYLQLLLAGRDQRFAYDQAFDITTAQLDEEFHDYLINSRRPRGTIQAGQFARDADYQSVEIEGSSLALALAELALNSGHFESAQLLFQASVDEDRSVARGLSGLGDALRMQDTEGRSQEIARYFIEAIELAPDDPNILLDYGEYWEAELLDCEKTWPAGQRTMILADIDQHFNRVVELAAESPEANLAMGQLYLLEGKEWQSGVSYQQKAFSLLTADTFIMEQSVKYAIAAQQYEEAERLINELAQPIHYFGEPGWVTGLRERLLNKRRGEVYDACAQGSL